LTEIYTLYALDKHIGMTKVKLRYPGYNAHEPYYHLQIYNIVSTLFHKRYEFRKKKVIEKEIVLIFATNLSQTFLILRRNERDIISNVDWCS